MKKFKKAFVLVLGLMMLASSTNVGARDNYQRPMVSDIHLTNYSKSPAENYAYSRLSERYNGADLWGKGHKTQFTFFIPLIIAKVAIIAAKVGAAAAATVKAVAVGVTKAAAIAGKAAAAAGKAVAGAVKAKAVAIKAAGLKATAIKAGKFIGQQAVISGSVEATSQARKAIQDSVEGSKEAPKEEAPTEEKKEGTSDGLDKPGDILGSLSIDPSYIYSYSDQQIMAFCQDTGASPEVEKGLIEARNEAKAAIKEEHDAIDEFELEMEKEHIYERKLFDAVEKLGEGPEPNWESLDDNLDQEAKTLVDKRKAELKPQAKDPKMLNLKDMDKIEAGERQLEADLNADKDATLKVVEELNAIVAKKEANQPVDTAELAAKLTAAGEAAQKANNDKLELEKEPEFVDIYVDPEFDDIDAEGYDLPEVAAAE